MLSVSKVSPSLVPGNRGKVGSERDNSTFSASEDSQNSIRSLKPTAREMLAQGLAQKAADVGLTEKVKKQRPKTKYVIKLTGVVAVRSFHKTRR